jgi:STE24 endopeptidase
MGWTGMWRRLAAAGAIVLVTMSPACMAAAAEAPQPGATPLATPHFPVRAADDAWRAALPREPEAATRAYLDRLSPEARARSDAYFEGGYWLTLWNMLLGLAVAGALLWTRPSTAVRDRARRVVRWCPLADALYGGFYALAPAFQGKLGD